MNKMLRPRKRGVKGTPRQPAADGLDAFARVPLYCAASGLLVVYAWGALQSFPLAMGGALCAVFAMSELLKPKLGELAAEAMLAKDKLGSVLMLGASIACIAFGALGGVIAAGAANGPRAAYDDARINLEVAQRRLDVAQRRLDTIPTCTPDMPQTRCAEQTLANAPTLADRTRSRDEAKQEREDAKAALAALPDPGPGVPHVETWQKALVVGGVEFVMFAVPFATRRRTLSEAVKAKVKAMEPSGTRAAPKARDTAKTPKPINDGGWAQRRAKYGPSGRKQRSLSGGAFAHSVPA